MHFILASECINKFDNIRKVYETEKQIDLHDKPSLIGKPIFFGGTDIINRNKQVLFLEKIKTILKIHLLKEQDIKSPLQQQAYIIASRFMIAACLYVQSQIGSSKRNSALFRLIEDNLGITSDNFLDDEDKETCYLTAERLLKSPQAFELANISLKNDGLEPFTEKEWKKFGRFLKEMSRKKDPQNAINHFPIMSITQPLFGAAFSYIGATVGVVLAEGASNSTSAISPRMQLTALVGSTLLVFSPSGTTGVALFAPVIATKLLTSFCTISLAHILGKTAGYLGQGIGMGVGLPFDLTYNLLKSICSLISNYYNKTSQLAAIDGIRIVDGTTIIAGIPVQLLPENTLPAGCTKKILEIDEDGELHIQGEREAKAPKPMKIPTEVFEEFKKHTMLQGKITEETQEEIPADTLSL